MGIKLRVLGRKILEGFLYTWGNYYERASVNNYTINRQKKKSREYIFYSYFSIIRIYVPNIYARSIACHGQIEHEQVWIAEHLRLSYSGRVPWYSLRVLHE